MGTNHTTMTYLRPGTTSDWITLPSYMSYVYKMCKNLPIQWIVVWMYPYSPSTPWRWVDLAEPGHQLGTNHISWHGWGQEPLRLDYIHYLCICKVFEHFWCSGWSYGCAPSPSMPWKWKWAELAESGWLNPSQYKTYSSRECVRLHCTITWNLYCITSSLIVDGVGALLKSLADMH